MSLGKSLLLVPCFALDLKEQEQRVVLVDYPLREHGVNDTADRSVHFCQRGAVEVGDPAENVPFLEDVSIVGGGGPDA